MSGGADSTALVALAVAAGLEVIAHHVDHGLRATSTDEAERAAEIGRCLGASVVVHRVDLTSGPNLEARARDARRGVLPAGTLTGHTADDQAETVLIRLLRGAGTAGLAGIRPGPTKPLLDLRRAETVDLCRHLGITPVVDPSNTDPAMWRNRIRHELLPLITDISERDPVPVLTRTADVLRSDDELLETLAAALDPTDADVLRDAHPALAHRALRTWLTKGGYPPDAAALVRVMGVVRGDVVACELVGGRRVARTGRRLRLIEPEQG